MPTDTLGLAAAKPVRARPAGDRRRWAAGASVLALALLWWAATRFGWVDVLFLPAPEQLFEALQRLWQGATSMPACCNTSAPVCCGCSWRSARRC